MRESIFAALMLSAKHNSKNMQNLSQRVTGEKADVVTKGDIEIGDLITKIILTTKAGVVVESEERGKQSNLQPGEEEKFYVAIDDIDGTNNLRVGKGLLPYCSMIVAFDGSKKTEEGYKYSDYTHAACLEYSSGRIFYTEKGLGKVEAYDLYWSKIGESSRDAQDNSGLAQTLSTDVVSTQRGGTIGYAQKVVNPLSILPGVLDTVYKKYAVVDSGCSVFEYAMVGMGIRDGYVSSGKKQHELPLLYAFSKETGKEMVDFDGKPYDDRVYDFKGGNAEVIAADQKTVEDVMKAIQMQKQAIERVKELCRTSFVKGPASAAHIREMNGKLGNNSEPKIGPQDDGEFSL